MADTLREDARGIVWPKLAFEDSCVTLHLWTQVIGKIRLALAPMINHWWQVPLYVSNRGLTTSLMPYRDRGFAIDFDFLAHKLIIQATDGARAELALQPRSVADFYAEVMGRLRSLGIDVHIWTMPVEIENAIPFEADHEHAAYDPSYVERLWRVLIGADRLLTVFRSGFQGKVSPVHFFWGSFDMAVTRFSGRTAPPPTGVTPNVGSWVMREAYSHEVSSCGFWPGNGGFGRPAFYCYAYPEPPDFARAPMRVPGAYYDEGLSQFILPYDAVQSAEQPDEAVLAFCQATYEAAADRGAWDRATLERLPSPLAGEGGPSTRIGASRRPSTGSARTG